MLHPFIIIAGIIGACVGAVKFRQWMKGPRCRSNARMDGKTVIITGSNHGIGKLTAVNLARRGARVIMACRNLEKAQQAQLEVVQESRSSNIVIKKLDLASMKSIREFAEEIKREEKRLDVLCNNAGLVTNPRAETEDGFEMQFGVNHLGHFLLTLLLLDLIKASAPARIVNVSSGAHEMGKIHFDDIMLTKEYGAMKSYCQSKLANILFTRELRKKLIGTGVTCYSLHPGAVNTDFLRHVTDFNRIILGLFQLIQLIVSPLLGKTPEEGAQTSIYCCVDETAGEETGLYYSDCAMKEPSRLAKDNDTAKKLWDLSLNLVGLPQEGSTILKI